MCSVIVLSVIMLSVIMLSVVMLNDIMLYVMMFSVVMLNVVILNVVAPKIKTFRNADTVSQSDKTFFAVNILTLTCKLGHFTVVEILHHCYETVYLTKVSKFTQKSFIRLDSEAYTIRHFTAVIKTVP